MIRLPWTQPLCYGPETSQVHASLQSCLGFIVLYQHLGYLDHHVQAAVITIAGGPHSAYAEEWHRYRMTCRAKGDCYAVSVKYQRVLDGATGDCVPWLHGTARNHDPWGLLGKAYGLSIRNFSQ